MTCKGCSNEIQHGQTYVALSRRIECEPFPGVVEVADATNVATYHLDCEPDAK